MSLNLIYPRGSTALAVENPLWASNTGTFRHPVVDAQAALRILGGNSGSTSKQLSFSGQRWRGLAFLTETRFPPRLILPTSPTRGTNWNIIVPRAEFACPIAESKLTDSLRHIQMATDSLLERVPTAEIVILGDFKPTADWLTQKPPISGKILSRLCFGL
ncbi:unnamed protein product [Pieris macdunnoughi]|uniref:Endonuclease/exonuclease/phosphatase domain-containing protein n=1 Tax=Pieris macdunnoughi TaxID=345717 RepID=A0A821VKG2_9NEOP|nr:unnamed protein product [Pieris macdunnoughi]